MIKSSKRIEIVRSRVAGLSQMGQKSCDMIQTVLAKHYEHVGISIVDTMRDLEAVIAQQPDLVFLGMKNMPLEDRAMSRTPSKIWMSAYFDGNGIAYTGSDSDAIALDFDKPAAKQVVKAAGLTTAGYFVANQGQYSDALALPLQFPLFVKPPNAGGGKGIGADSVIRDFAAFEQKVAFVTRDFHSPALVEEYLPGREFSVAILETPNSEELMVMPIELITEQNGQGDRILGQKIKAADIEHVVAVPIGAIRSSVVELATKAFRALGARDYGRIDIRLDQHGTACFMEANLIPGLAFHDFVSYFTSACWVNQTMDYETMILHIVALGLTRSVSEAAVILDTGLPVKLALKPFGSGI